MPHGSLVYKKIKATGSTKIVQDNLFIIFIFFFIFKVVTIKLLKISIISKFFDNPYSEVYFLK